MILVGTGLFLPIRRRYSGGLESPLAGNEPSVDHGHRFPSVPEDGVESQVQKTTDNRREPKLPIFSILNSIEFSDHFVIIADVGTGKRTVTPIHEYEFWMGNVEITIRQPS